MKYAAICLILTACMTASIPEETGTIEAFFCDQVDCAQVFAEKTANAKSLSCALYHVNNDFFGLLDQKDATLVTDEEHPLPGSVAEFGSGLMHNKFCVLDNQYVWTGSWNPAQEMTIPNNAVFIQSKTLANAYQTEFDELSGGEFHGGSSFPGLVKLNGNLIEAYFCPEDDCKDHVLDVLNRAQQSIHFMTYAFTDNDIGDLLIDKKNQGLEVKGVFDPRKNKYSEYEKLRDISTIEKVHHKVFIVDKNTVITGSYNPSEAANERNDENIIIIRDPQIAQQFEEEFSRLFGSS